jgi:hypothetical protein
MEAVCQLLDLRQVEAAGVLTGPEPGHHHVDPEHPLQRLGRRDLLVRQRDPELDRLLLVAGDQLG